MAKFKKKTNTSQDIPTAALPDIIFMLLFFFMVTTVMRENDFIVDFKVPPASSLQKIHKKTLVSYIYIGTPKEEFQSKYGKEPVIQTNDVIIKPINVRQFIATEKGKLPSYERDKIWISLKVDKEAKMGIVVDVKQELRKANALKVNYSSAPGVVN